MDYSEKLIGILRKVFGKEELKECICCEAVDCPTDIRFKESTVEGYWNNAFVFNCFVERK